MQSFALQVTTVLLLALLACFVWVLMNTRGLTQFEKVAAPAYRLRGKLFVVASAVGAVITVATLTPWPHDAGAKEVTRYIDVKARQWSWELSDKSVRVGEVIEFRVTSEDVNHGFGLYDSDKRLIAQIQAMPGFTNKVRHRFDHAGKYEILCLEFCGVAHHAMVAEIDAQPAATN
jgi:cytochrome c oxidase subunit II